MAKEVKEAEERVGRPRVATRAKAREDLPRAEAKEKAAKVTQR